MKSNLIFNKFKAFTLAEVLLVVAIIGITAALALPNLSQNVDEDKYVMLAKTTYNQLETGVSRMLTNKSIDEIISDAGVTTKADATKAIVAELSKYIKMTKNCGNDVTQCYNLSKNYVEYDGTSIEDKPFASSFSSDAAAFTLPSGAVVVVVNVGNEIGSGIYMYFDVDGVKGPCKKGIDIFNAHINNEDEFTYTSDENGDPALEPDYGALSWVLSIGNMDYLHCNDLNWSTKHQCD